VDPVFVIVAVSVLVLVLGIARMAWRILRHNEEMQSGGSLGTQALGRSAKKPS